MKKTALKDAIRNVWKNKVTALSITVVIMLSVGVFLGTFFYMSCMSHNGDIFYKKHNFKDLDIYSSQGISDKELETIKEVEGVKDAEGINLLTTRIIGRDESVSITVQSITERISITELKEGALPEAEDEIALGAAFAKEKGIKIGDEIELDVSGGQDRLLKKSRFKVTGFVLHPDYARSTMNNFGVMDISAFKMEENMNYYTGAVVTAEYPDDVNVFSGRYYKYIEKIQEKLERTLDEMGKTHTEEIKTIARTELENVKKEAEKKISEAETKVDEGWETYYETVDAATASVTDAREQISYYEGYIDRADEDLAYMEGIYYSQVYPIETRVSEAKEVVDSYVSPDYYDPKVEEALNALNLTETFNEYYNLYYSITNKIYTGRSEINSSRATLEEYKSQLSDKETEFKEKKTEGRETLEEAETQLEEKKTEYNETVEEKESEIEAIDTTHYLVFNRKSNVSYADLLVSINIVRSASICFAFMFVLISMLVCFSTIYLIIDKQSNLVGNSKAMGIFNRDIRNKYLVYGLSAVIIGVILGFILEVTLQVIFGMNIGSRYVFSVSDIYFSIWPALIIVVVDILVAIIATFVACSGLLKLSSVQLMNGEKGGKKKVSSRRGGKSGTLYSRLILRNVFSEKERVFISIIIIASSCLVIGVGFTLKFSFTRLLDKQLNEVQQFDVQVTYDPDKYEKQVDEVVEYLEASGTEFGQVKSWNTAYDIRGNQNYTNIMVADPDIIKDFYNLRDYKTKKRIDVPEKEILISQRFSEVQNLENGDLIYLFDGGLDTHSFRVKGNYSLYAGILMFMSDSRYKEEFGEDPVANTFLIKLNGVEEDILVNNIHEIMPEAEINTRTTTRESYTQGLFIYDIIIMIMIFLAIILSVFVLSNMVSIFVSGKKKEMIIMRINGFSTKQTIGYLFREAVFTMVVALVMSLIMGVLSNRFVISMFEQEHLMFVRTPIVRAWVIAVLAESVFAIFIDFLAFRKVKKMRVTDIF